jgi:Fe-S-cluster containining protein
MSWRRPAEDQALIQIVDAALADAASRSGDWLACRPGCTQCCIGVFAINALDAARLQEGLAHLEQAEPERAKRVRRRARDSAARLSAEFPGSAKTGVLAAEVFKRGSKAEQRFADFANDEACPALDRETGLCDLYSSRPMTCRTFGPPVRAQDGLGVCELCFEGASDEEIAACEMIVDPDDLESQLLISMKNGRGSDEQTLVAFALK